MIFRKTTMKQLRERAELSQDELARQMGVTTSAVAKWDQKRSFPKLYPADLIKLTEVLKCSINELIEAQREWEGSNDD